MPIYQLDPAQLQQIIDSVHLWGSMITGVCLALIFAVTWKG